MIKSAIGFFNYLGEFPMYIWIQFHPTTNFLIFRYSTSLDIRFPKEIFVPTTCAINNVSRT